MERYQQQFIDQAIAAGALKFGEFELKSGRVSPYFFNAGLFNSGRALDRLGHAYAQAIVDSSIDFDMLFGPAYKGIPLVTATALAMAEYHGRDLPWCFNRKEVKDHGEGGNTVGAPLAGRILIIDDVITAGTAIRESMALIQTSQAQAAGVVIALDRQERGQGGLSAIQEVERNYGIPVISIIRLDDLVNYLGERPDLKQSLDAIRTYRDRYGI